MPCHETPARLDFVLAALAKRPVGTLCPPSVPNASHFDLIARIHTPQYLAFLAQAWGDWLAIDPANAECDILPSVWPGKSLRRDVMPANFSARVGHFAFDAGSPISEGTWQAALAGAACAIDAARAVMERNLGSELGAKKESNVAVALTRPPGHHAGADFYGGYCFLNNSALAAQALREAGAARVAMIDVDYHHGNGTQSIFYARGDVFTASIHGDPHTEYPFYLGYADETGEGAGAGANLNLPLPRGTGFAAWLLALDTAIAAARAFSAEALVVPLGVDTYEGDPISSFKLKSADFYEIGRRLATLNLPTVFVLEGGYAVADVGDNVVNVLQGFEEQKQHTKLA